MLSNDWCLLFLERRLFSADGVEVFLLLFNENLAILFLEVLGVGNLFDLAVDGFVGHIVDGHSV